MKDYTDSSIYKIVDTISGKEYYGSTKFSIEKRLKSHERTYKLYLRGGYHYVSSFEILRGGTYRIELLEKVSCATRDELLLKESIYIRNNPNCINRYKKARRTEDEEKEAIKQEGYKRSGVYITCDVCNKTVSKRNISIHKKEYCN